MKRELLTPRQMYERLVQSYMFSYAAQGKAVEVRDVERQVTEELQIVDAARRNGELTGGGQRDTSPSVIRPDELAAAQAQTGTVLTVDRDPELRGAAHRYRPNALHRNPMAVSARWGAAVARIGRILEGAAGGTLVDATKNAQIPALAKKWVEVYGFYMTRARAPAFGVVDHNPFRGMSDRDASRAFMRAVEDICDKSTGVLGSWYVK